jgi:tetratricopeptide (TPR) repeat protein
MVLWGAAVALAQAQTVMLKDGRLLAAANVKRAGDQVMLESASGAQVSMAVGEIVRIDFPEPPDLGDAVEKVVEGKGAEAVVLLERIVAGQADFREIPGNWWSLAALRLAQALESLGRGLEAQALAEKIVGEAIEPELVKAAQAQVAAVILRRGDRAGAIRRIDPVLREARGDTARALAHLVRGQCWLAEENWEEAMLSFVQVPVFHATETILFPAVMLGRGRALLGLADFAGARSTLEELRAVYPGAPEAKLALPELQRVADRERAARGDR